jgi:putative membrane protein
MTRAKRIARGAAAGAAGGLAASWMMGLLTRFAPKELQEESQESTAKAADAVTRAAGSELPPSKRKPASQLVHYAFGTMMGAAYGAATEWRSELSAATGVPFGTAVWLGAHVTAVPALRWSKPVYRSTLKKEMAEFLAHWVYGAVTELVRRGLRRWAF